MTRIFRTLAIFLFFAPVAVLPTEVHADATGDSVLSTLDKKADVFTDTSYTATMTIYKNGKVKKTLQFFMMMKGLEKQFIVFTAPGDVAGMKILMNGPELWMYNTEFKKVRKIAAHAQSQGFFGSDFSAEDMVLAKLSDKFTGVIQGKKGSETVVALTPKPDSGLSVSKMEIVIDSKVGHITEMRYFDGSGNIARVQTRTGWKKVGGHLMPTKILMANKKTGSKTVIELAGIKVNQGLSDGDFSKRTLLR